MTCPCKDCTARTMICHDRCGKYIAWKNTMPKKKADIAGELLQDGINKDMRRKNRKTKRYNYGRDE